MIIQHNIMAMNSHRQLGINNTNVGKNLEKLSSGFRINRAGDDAAGLAISEKMRAQIKGLEVAQKNALDGISLIQTAEGSLTEVHSMLNRMVELATQSANGIYTDTDRAKLQDEVKALKDEINRISEGTDFNGIKLLDGSLGREAGFDIKAISGAVASRNSAPGSVVGTTDGVAARVAPAQLVNNATGVNTIAAVEAKNATFTVTLDDIAGTDLSTPQELYLQIGDTTFKIDGISTDGSGDLTAATIAAKFKDLYNDNSTDVTIGGKAYTFATNATTGVITFTAKETFDITTTQLGAITATQTGATSGATWSPATVAGTQAGVAEVKGSASFGFDPSKVATGSLLTVGGTQFIFQREGDPALSSTEIGSKTVINLTKGDLSFEQIASKVVNAINSANITSTTPGLGGLEAKLNDSKNQIVVSQKGPITNAMATAGTTTAMQNQITSTAGATVTAVRAQATASIDFSKVTTGSKVSIGNSTFVFQKDGETATLQSGEILVALSSTDTTASNVVTKLVAAATTNGTEYDLAAGSVAGTFTVTQKTGNETAINKNTFANLVKFTGSFEYGKTEISLDASKIKEGALITIEGQTFEFVSDLSKLTDPKNKAVLVNNISTATVDGLATNKDLANALNAAINAHITASDAKMTSSVDNNGVVTVTTKSTDLNVTPNVTSGSGLKLQVGDTNDAYQKVSVVVGNMSADALGIGTVDISTYKGAGEAISSIKAAIEKVSSQRGALGALQNRLEHTIANLGVTTENMTAAESRIRDTDMAKEMMAFTKNNVLVNAAQAMLAQANQQPQSILQLLR